MISNFPNGFKTLQIFPDDCQFSKLFQNCPDFSRWLPIFRIISKLSGFFQMTANFPDDLKTVRIFPDDCQFSGLFQNCPDFSRWLPIFQIISKLSGFFQITANFPDYFKTVLIFPDYCQFSGWFQNFIQYFRFLTPKVPMQRKLSWKCIGGQQMFWFKNNQILMLPFTDSPSLRLIKFQGKKIQMYGGLWGIWTMSKTL